MSRDDTDRLYGVHPVLEAIERDPRSVARVWVAREDARGRIGRVLRVARQAGVPVSHVPRDVLARRAGRHAVHQGIVADVAPVRYAEPDEIVRRASEARDGVVLALDGVEDPRNLGAILRSGAAAGVSGVLLSDRRTAGLTATAVKASAGAAARLRIARDPGLGRRLEAFRAAGFRVVGLAAEGPVTWDDPAVDLAGPVVLVAGGEGRGLRRGLSSKCDTVLAIPMARGVESLNVSVAVAIVLFEAVRRRRAASGSGVSPGGTGPGRESRGRS